VLARQSWSPSTSVTSVWPFDSRLAKARAIAFNCRGKGENDLKNNKDQRPKRPIAGPLVWLIGGALCVAVAALLSNLLSDQLSRLLPARTASVQSAVKFEGTIGPLEQEEAPVRAALSTAPADAFPLDDSLVTTEEVSRIATEDALESAFVIESVSAAAAPNPSLGDFLPAVLDIDLQSVREMECLALNIYHEARGEGANGQRAVGHVVLNRVSDPDFPDSIRDPDPFCA